MSVKWNAATRYSAHPFTTKTGARVHFFGLNYPRIRGWYQARVHPFSSGNGKEDYKTIIKNNIKASSIYPKFFTLCRVSATPSCESCWHAPCQPSAGDVPLALLRSSASHDCGTPPPNLPHSSGPRPDAYHRNSWLDSEDFRSFSCPSYFTFHMQHHSNLPPTGMPTQKEANM